MECPFLEIGVKDVVWDCDGNKTLGPGGFTLEFFKNQWETVKKDVMKFISDFHSKEILIKACISFISMIPKVPNPQSLLEYRPICLVGSLLKILSKLLAGRLKEMIERLILSKQTTFIRNRNILGGVLIVNELLGDEGGLQESL